MRKPSLSHGSPSAINQGGFVFSNISVPLTLAFVDLLELVEDLRPSPPVISIQVQRFDTDAAEAADSADRSLSNEPSSMAAKSNCFARGECSAPGAIRRVRCIRRIRVEN